MRLPKLAIANYQFVLIVVFLAVVMGVFSVLTMPRSEDPNLELPFFRIVIVYPGTSPEDMEELVANPVEDALKDLDDIDDLKTSIKEGVVIARVEAEFGIDVEDKYDEVVAAISGVSDELPEDLFSLDIFKFNPDERVLIQQFALVSETASFHNMVELAEDFEDEIETFKFVKDVDIVAYPEEEVRVSLDFQKMANQNISLNQVVGTLSGNNVNIPGGDVNAADKSFNIKSTGGYKALDEIRNTVISANGNSLVYLKDIANVNFDYEDQDWVARMNGSRCIYLNVTQKGGSNLLQLTEDINAKVEEFKSQLPEGITVIPAFEQAPAVANRINSFFNSLVQGVLLVGLIIFIFLGFRPSLVIMTVIPLSIIMAIGVIDAYDYGLQQISIAALVIALGLLVDNGIVVIENIVRFQKMGFSLKEAAAKGTSEVGWAVVSSTVTTLLAFFPLTQLESGPGEFLRSLPFTVIFVLIASLILALTFTPIMAGRFLSTKRVGQIKVLERILNKFIHTYYRRLLNFSLRRPYIIFVLATITFAGSLTLFPAIGVSFFPYAEKPLLLIEVDSPDGSNVARTDRAVQYVEQVLDSTDYVKSYAINSGHGNPQIYYNRIPESFKKSHGQILVNFTSWDPPVFYQTLSQLRRAFALYPDAKITFSELKNGPPFEAPIAIKILGDDLDTLKAYSIKLEELLKETEGTLNVENPLTVDKTDLKININRDKAGLLGLSLVDIDRAIRASLTGLTVDQVTMEDGEEFDMVVRIPFDDKPDIEDFYKVYFTSRTGAQIPLQQVAQIEFEGASSEIEHYNTVRNVTVKADVYDADATAKITEGIIERLDEIPLPAGYEYYIAGEYETQQESFGDLGQLLIVALLGIFAVLVLQFRSLRQPLIVFSAIPLAITGSLVALYLTGWSFSFFAFVGFTSLVGIVVNNSIILVDYTNQLRRQGASMLRALKKAAETRFTPIILTTTTTILGLLPLTIARTSLWSPLGWTIIGGMISSTFLTLVIVPILYRLFTKEKVG